MAAARPPAGSAPARAPSPPTAPRANAAPPRRVVLRQRRGRAHARAGCDRRVGPRRGGARR
eukprot:scaffold1571_cov26-Phaeocystis_antarctica.AAC.2